MLGFFFKFHFHPNLRSNFCNVLRQLFAYQSLLIEGWVNRNIDDNRCEKMPIFSYIRIWNRCICRLLCKLIISNECLVYIYSLDFPLIIYLANIGQFHIFFYFDQQQAEFAVRGPRPFPAKKPRLFSRTKLTLTKFAALHR